MIINDLKNKLKKTLQGVQKINELKTKFTKAYCNQQNKDTTK